MHVRSIFKRYSELILYKTYVELRSEASSYFLGMIWWVLEPALYLIAFYSIFHWGIRQGTDDYASFLLIALVHWKWFASSLISSSNSIVGSKSLISQVYLPKIIFPAFTVSISTTKFLITTIVMFVILGLFEAIPSWSNLFWLLPLWLIQLLIGFSLGSILAVLVPLAKDFKPIIENGIIVLMLISGIFFDIRNFDPDVQFFFLMNPIAALITQYRLIILEAGVPDFQILIAPILFTLVFGVISVYIHVRMNRIIPKLLI